MVVVILGTFLRNPRFRVNPTYVLTGGEGVKLVTVWSMIVESC